MITVLSNEMFLYIWSFPFTSNIYHSNDQVRSQICTYHNGCAVVMFVEIWHSLIIIWHVRMDRLLATLQWRHNDHDSVSNHQPQGCLLNRLFRRRSKKTSKLRVTMVTGLCVGNSPGPVNSPHKGPVTRKMFPFEDVIMIHGVMSS